MSDQGEHPEQGAEGLPGSDGPSRPPPPPPGALDPGPVPWEREQRGRLLPLRPLTVGDILDSSFRALRATFATAAVLVLLVQGPYQMVSSLIITRVLPDFDDPAQLEQNFADPAAAIDFFIRIASVGTVVGIVGMVVNVLVGAAVVWVMLRADQDLPTGVGAALGAAGRRLWATLGGSAVLLLMGFGALLGLGLVIAAAFAASPPLGVLVAVPTLPLSFLLFLALIYLIPPVAVVEERGPWHTLRRCFWVLGRRFGRVLGVTLLMTLLVSVITVSLTLPLGFLAEVVGPWGWVVDGSASTLAALVSVPLSMAAALLLYLDARVRLEGYDLELRARRLGAE